MNTTQQTKAPALLAIDHGRWWRKAHQHQRWYAAWRAELRSLETTLEGLTDLSALRKIVDRAAAIEKRVNQLERVMGRHLKRTPDLLPELQSASQRRG